MSTWKMQKRKDSFRNYWLQKSEKRQEEKDWLTKLDKVAKAVTQYIRSSN